jgi:hypothetical protein
MGCVDEQCVGGDRQARARLSGLVEPSFESACVAEIPSSSFYQVEKAGMDLLAVVCPEIFSRMFAGG